MSLEFVDGTGLWSVTTGVAPPPPPPDENVSHSPHDWRAVNPRMRKRILRGVLPEEFIEEDKTEVERLLRLLDDLDNLPS